MGGGRWEVGGGRWEVGDGRWAMGAAARGESEGSGGAEARRGWLTSRANARVGRRVVRKRARTRGFFSLRRMCGWVGVRRALATRRSRDRSRTSLTGTGRRLAPPSSCASAPPRSGISRRTRAQQRSSSSACPLHYTLHYIQHGRSSACREGREETHATSEHRASRAHEDATAAPGRGEREGVRTDLRDVARARRLVAVRVARCAAAEARRVGRDGGVELPNRRRVAELELRRVHVPVGRSEGKRHVCIITGGGSSAHRPSLRGRGRHC